MASLYDDTPQPKPKEKKPRQPKLPKEYGLGGGLSNQAPLNDYRNRMPFRVVKENGEDLYVWQYGAVFELELEITDQDVEYIPQDVVTDVIVRSGSVVDRATKIADIALGTMAYTDANLYMKASQLEKIVTETVIIINDAKRITAEANKLMDAVEAALTGRGAVADAIIESLQKQITDLRGAVTSLQEVVKQVKELKTEVSSIHKEITDEVNGLRTEYQNRLREITTLYAEKINEMETRCQSRMDSTAEAFDYQLSEVKKDIAEIYATIEDKDGSSDEEPERTPDDSELTGPPDYNHTEDDK